VDVDAHNVIVGSKVRLERIGPLSALMDLSVRDFDWHDAISMVLVVMVLPLWIGLTIERAVSQLQCFNGPSALDMEERRSHGTKESKIF
jgi:hypothetical protein